MLSEKKRLQQFFYVLMSLLIVMQSFLPLTALAETTEAQNLTLGQVTFDKKNINQGKLQLHLKNQTAQEELSYQTTARLISSSLVVAGQSIPLSVDQNRKIIKIPLKENSEDEAELHFILAEDSLKAGATIQFATETQQTTPVALPTIATTETTGTSGTISETSETISSSAEASSETTTTSETTTESTETTTETTTSNPATTTTTDQQSAVAANDAANDIRTYFPNGDGTILTGSSLTYLDDNGNPVKPPITLDTTVRIHYDWSIPEDIRKQIKPGDTFTFDLPDNLKPNQADSGDLVDGDGIVYGHYQIGTDGKVVFTFTDQVSEASDITGNFYFDGHLDQSKIDQPGDTTINFPEGDQLPPVDVVVRPDTEDEIDKQGHFDKTPNPAHVTWTVDVNQAMKNQSNPTITETWPKGINYQSVKVYRLVMNLDGTVKEVGEELSPEQYTVDANGNVTIKGDTNDAYRLVYQTDIDQSAIPDQGGKVTFQNKASLTDDNNSSSLDAKATVTTTYGKELDKNRDGYNAKDQTFDWSIKYNYGEKDIPQKDAVISDHFSSNNMSLVGDSLKVYPVTFDKNGNEQLGEPLKEGTDYELVANPDGPGFVVKFLHDVDGAVHIKYQTKVDGLVTDTTQVNNEVSVDDDTKDNANGNATQQNVIKSLGDVDYDQRLAQWHYSVNQNHYQMNDLVLTDSYSPTPGLTLAKKADGNYDLSVYDQNTGKYLTLGKDYQLQLTYNDKNEETGFKIQLVGSFASTTDSFYISYRTNFDVSLLDPNDPDKSQFVNNVDATWHDENDKPHHSDSTKPFKPTYPYSLNAQKSGVYNAQTKLITWIVAVNLSKNELENAQLLDPIKDNQAYVAGSVKVYLATTEKDGTVVKASEDPVNDSMKKITEPSGTNKNLEIDFPEGLRQTYLIEFQTSLVDKVIDDQGSYENKATYTNQGESRDVIGEVSIKNGGSLAQKTGEQDPENPDYVNWHFTINPSQSTLSNVVVTDQPSINQVLDEDSIVLYGMDVAADGSLTANKNEVLTAGTDYTVDITTDNETGQQVMTIKFLKKISRAYDLEYRSFITSSASGNSDKVSNQASLTGSGSKDVHGDTNHDVNVTINHSGGNASGKRGKITIQKNDADGRTALTGVHFQLWDTEKKQLLREGDVNSLGLITFGGLPYGDYLLVETATAPGYTISDELVRGKRITISAQTSSQSASPTVIINRKTSIILKKAAEDGSPLAGAQFKLEKLDKIGLLNQYLWTPVDLGGRDVTDANGQLSILGMTVGTYRITEIKAPAGYILNPNPIIFDVTMNNSHQIGEIHLAVTNYQGSAQLIKKDQEGNPLAGASFNVLDSAGNVVNSQPLVSNQNGVVSITGLAPGNYSFVETKAPNGYLLNTTPVSFTIANQVFGKPAVVTATDNFINYQGSAAFRKTDDKKNPLAGAVFALYAADDQGKPTGEPLQQNLVSDANGRVLAENLSPGHYVFVETKAPAGFLINTENLSFTIAAKHAGEPKILDLGDYLDYQGGFIITKVNSKNQPLAGAVFELFDGHGQSTGRKVTSGKDGVVRFDHLAPGTYYFKEIVAPKVEGTDLDYVINDSMIKVTIANHAKGNPETDQEFHYDLGNFQNFTGEADVTKNAKGGSAAGAVFRLWVIAPDGVQRQLSDFTVDQSGKLDLSKLGAGNYKLLEIKAAPHHILNSQPIYFTVKENQPGEVDNLNFDNYQVEVIGSKVNAEKEALAGATYEIYQADQNNQPMGDPVKFLDRHDIETSLITTDKTGEIYAKGLEVGHYVLIEKSAPKGYLLDTTVHPFEVTEQMNKPEPIKLGDFIDYQGSAELIKKDTDGHKLAGAEFNVLDSSGKVVNKKPLISDKEGKVTIDHLAPGDYQFVETKTPVGYLLNTTKVAFTIANQAEGKPAIVSVGDFINYQGSAELIKTDDQGNTLTDAKFNVLDSSGKVVNKKPLIANPEGKITVDHLAPGDYQFVEIKAPTGYILNTTKIDFTITDQAADAPAVVKVGNFINYQGAAELIKTDDQGKALAGAKFNVTNTAGQVMNAQPLVSDKDGKVTIDHLAPGTYYFKEVVAPTGYILNSEPIRFTIAYQGKGQPEVIEVGNFTNYQGSAELIKTDEAGEVLAGAEFNVLDSEGKVVNAQALVSDKDGEVTIDHLAPGNYQFVETKAPTGYVLNTKPIDFTIVDKADGQPEILEVGNFTNYQGSAVLIKTDDQGNALADAEFNVLDSKGKVVNAQALVSDKDGKVTIDNLAPGDYQFEETKAPTGYVLNTTKINFTIADKADGKPVVVSVGDFINYQGSFKITKVNSNGEALKGAVFELFDDKQQSTGKKVTSDTAGSVIFDHLAPGTYYFKEIVAPKVAGSDLDYVINDSLIKVEIAPHAQGDPQKDPEYQFDFGHFQNFKGQAAVTKVGEGKSIAGTQFVLWRIDKNGQESKVSELTVSADGKLPIDDLPVGNYKLVEIKPAPGYISNTQPIYFTIATDHPGEVDNLNFKNYQSEITGKKVGDDGQALAGAIFEIYAADKENQPIGKAIKFIDANGQTATKITTDAQGKVYAKGLEEGHYVLVEKQAPKGYLLDTKAHPFDVKAQLNEPKPIELGDLINYQGSVKLIKTDEKNQPLAGAEFNVLDNEGEVVNAQPLKSDKEGKVTIDHLAPGDYQFVETKALTGYVLNIKPIDFTIADKADGQPEVIEVGNFTNYQGSAELIKTDEKNQPLAGAEFNVLDSEGEVVNAQPLKSDKEGKVTIDHLAPGDYQFVETKAPTGYVLNTKPIDFTIIDKAEGQPEVIEVGNFTNYQGSAELIKTDKKNQPLAGAEFNVLDSEGKVVNAQPLKSDKEGKVTIDHLSPGDYQFLETKAPTGYVLNTKPIDFTIADKAEGQPKVIEVGNFTNYQGSAELIKTDEKNQPLAGAEFNVLDSEGKVVNAQPLKSDKEGKVTIDHLSPGDYQFLETKAPTGYVLNTTKIDFTITDKAEGQPEIIEVGNFTNYQGSAELIKTDEKNQPLAGAEFNLLDSEGKMVNAQPLKSDKEGKVTVDHLAPGDYQFVETKAPTGYVLNTTKIDFTITDKAEGQPKVIEVGNFTNYQGSAKLIKTDEKNQPLAGAEFNVLDSEGKVVNAQPLKSDKEGKVTIDHLAPGDYQFVETKAPTGYVLNTKPIDFTIADKATGQPATVSAGRFINKLLPEKTPTKPGTKHGNNYPKTNDVNMPLYLGMGLVIVLATGFIWFKKQRS